jgi:RING finger protein 170
VAVGVMSAAEISAALADTGVQEYELIEGISNQLLAFLVTSFLGILTCVFLLQKMFSRTNNVIHPDAQEQVLRARQASAGTPQRQSNASPEDDCPICLVPFNQLPLVVETNCGHVFCAACLLHFRDLSHLEVQRIPCPVCRQPISFILRHSMTSQSGYDEQNEQVREQLQALYRYNRMFSGEARSIVEVIQDMPALLRHYVRNIFSLYSLQVVFRLRTLVLMVTALLYILLPIDLIPEALFGVFGLLDDLFIIFCVVTWFSVQYRDHVLHHNTL